MKSKIITNNISSSNRFMTIERLVNAFQNLDVKPFEELLSENLKWDYNNKNKYDLLAHLKQQFENLKAQGNTELMPIYGECVGCNKGEGGYRFVSNKTKARLTYVFTELDDGKFDLSPCKYFHVPGEPLPDMSNPF